MPAVRSRGGAGEVRVKPRSDAYVGLLGLSLLALSAAILFAFLNYQGLADKPKPVQMAPPVGGGGRMPAGPGPGVAPGQVAPGGVPGQAVPGGAPAPAPPGANPPPQPAPQPQKK